MYTNFLLRLQEVCLKNKLSLTTLGNVNGFPITQIIINPNSVKTIVFSAGIHGDEIAGPLAILEFLKKKIYLKFPNLKIIIYPVASPTGFDLCQRLNYLGQDLNRMFCQEKLTGEAKILFDSLSHHKITLFHSLHEDLDEKSFYLYNFENTYQQIYRDLVMQASKYFPINMSSSIYGDPSLRGLITNIHDGSFEDRLFSEGVPYSLCTETPGQQPLQARVDLSLELMRQILVFTSEL